MEHVTVLIVWLVITAAISIVFAAIAGWGSWTSTPPRLAAVYVKPDEDEHGDGAGRDEEWGEAAQADRFLLAEAAERDAAALKGERAPAALAEAAEPVKWWDALDDPQYAVLVPEPLPPAEHVQSVLPRQDWILTELSREPVFASLLADMGLLDQPQKELVPA